MAKLYHAEFKDRTARATVEEARQKLARGEAFGVTVVGNHLTIRFGRDGLLKQLHCLIIEVDDGKPEEFDPCEEDK